MAIEFVGSAALGKVGSTSASSTIALNSGLTGGIASSVSEGDLVIAIFGSASDNADRTLSITDGTTDYTLIGTEQFSADTEATNLRIAYKFMGVTPDASTTFGPTGNNSDAGATMVYVLRGVDQTTPLDVAVTAATGANTTLVNPPAITPMTTGAWVICVGAGAHTGAVDTYSSSDLSGFATKGGANDSNDVSIGAGYFAWTSGAFDAAQWTHTHTPGTTNSWASTSIALRPAASNKTLTADAGSYTLTGTAATPKLGRAVAAGTSSYAVTGSTSGIAKGRRLAADTGSYAVTGTAATLKRGFKTTADTGAYSLTGEAASVNKGRRLVVDAGAYTLTGVTASLLRGGRVVADTGSYTLSGQTAALLSGYTLVAGAGSYTLSGSTATLLHGLRIVAGVGSYAMTGVDATLGIASNKLVAADAGSYTLTGAAATLLRAYVVGAGAGSYTLTGTAADLAIAGTGGLAKVYLSGAFAEKPMKVYLSGAWSTKPIKVYLSATWTLS